jgi:hypothetical protein
MVLEVALELLPGLSKRSPDGVAAKSGGIGGPMDAWTPDCAPLALRPGYGLLSFSRAARVGEGARQGG